MTCYSEPNYKTKARKVTKSMATQMKKMRAKGKTWAEIANKFGVTSPTVKYNVDADFRQYEIERCSNK